jgi:hypothetical protein
MLIPPQDRTFLRNEGNKKKTDDDDEEEIYGK